MVPVNAPPEAGAAGDRAYYMIQVIAGAETRDAARKANDALWVLAHCSFGAPEDDFAQLDQAVSKARNDVRNAMRIELGVEE
jgi:hypothetical protein